MKRRSFIGCLATLFVFPVKSSTPTLTDRFCNYPVKLTEEIKVISASVDTNFKLNNILTYGFPLEIYEDINEVPEVNVELTYEDGSVRRFTGCEKRWTCLPEGIAEEPTEPACRYDGKDIFITYQVDGCKDCLCTISNVTEVFDET